MNYDDVQVRRVVADENAVSNGLVTNNVMVRVHKVVVTGDGSNVVSVDLHDDSNASNALLIKISLSGQETTGSKFSRYVESDHNPPVEFKSGVALNLTGNTAAVYLYYTKK